MWEELGISGGTAIIILIALYFIIKWAVKNGIKQAWGGTQIEKRKMVNNYWKYFVIFYLHTSSNSRIK